MLEISTTYENDIDEHGVAIVHLEFAAAPLPEPLKWYTADRIAKSGEQ